MSLRKTLIVLVGILFLGISYYKWPNRRTTERKSSMTSSVKSDQQQSLAPKAQVPKPSLTENTIRSQGFVKSQSSEEQKIKLNESNFENYVGRCFQGDPCEFQENPMDLYWNFKKANDRKANDLLISYMRKNLQNQVFAKQYKEILKKMIDDFYPPDEKQFQEAAYYNYLGDLRKSLDLYLDLEKKNVKDPSLRPAPKLNIANTYYDLGRFSDALPYYQAALGNYLSQQEQAAIPNQNDLIRFIEDRIEACKAQI